MKKYWKTLVAVTCALALAAGTAVATGMITTRMLEVQYMGVRLVVNGKDITVINGAGDPTEPFVVDGTTYVPVRVLGEILGKDVNWDQGTRTVTIGEAPFVEDAKELVSYVESAHPAFPLNQIPDGYDAARETLLETAADSATTLYDFSWAALAYTASLRDGHTSLNVFGSGAQSALDIAWTAVGDELYLTGEDGAAGPVRVTEIGGVSVDKVFSAVDRYFVSENDAGRSVNRAQWSANENLLHKVGAAFNTDGTVTVKLINQPERKIPFALPQQNDGQQRVIAAEKKDDVYYIDLNACVVGDETDAVAADLKSAIEKGTKKVIIDVRGNGGGNSEAPLRLLHAMGMEAPSYGSYTRYSSLALDEIQAPYLPAGVRRNYQQSNGAEQTGQPTAATAKPNPDVELVVLTDENTFSSALMLGVWVRDGKLGTVIGRPSSNAPSHFGDILYYTLGNTGIYGTVSHIQWQRPDPNADPATLEPDIETAVGEDALPTALDFLKDPKTK